MSSAPSIPVYGFSVVAVYPHDSNESTEGLFYLDGFFYESSGQPEANSISNIRKVDIETGVPQLNVELNSTVFAEGITPWNNSIIMLTYQSETAFVYSLADLTQENTFLYQGQGWGLTQDGTSLIMSNGSPTVRFLDPVTFGVTRSIQVMNGTQPWPGANELEYVNGEIWATMSGTDQIARISPADGTITGWIDLSKLYPVSQRPTTAGEMNGIAYDAVQNRIFITGKCWPKLFQIEVTPPPGY
jgi:glutaminyl-peptide cyclotransferase